jgi:hypothetical protein
LIEGSGGKLSSRPPTAVILMVVGLIVMIAADRIAVNE